MPSEAQVLRDFLYGLRKVRSNHQYGWAVDELQDYTDHTVLLVAGGWAGCAVSPEKELVSVWSLLPKTLPRIVAVAIHAGAEWLTCYDTGLVEKYSKLGFRETMRAAFDPDLGSNVPAGIYPDFVRMDLIPSV